MDERVRPKRADRRSDEKKRLEEDVFVIVLFYFYTEFLELASTMSRVRQQKTQYDQNTDANQGAEHWRELIRKSHMVLQYGDVMS
jgi:hypothetical protein